MGQELYKNTPFEGLEEKGSGITEERVKEFNKILHNSKVFDVLDSANEIEEVESSFKLVNWQEYHPTTQEEVEESFIKMSAAPDYSSEPENYGK